jgi:hypothetical protein
VAAREDGGEAVELFAIGGDCVGGAGGQYQQYKPFPHVVLSSPVKSPLQIVLPLLKVEPPGPQE